MAMSADSLRSSRSTADTLGTLTKYTSQVSYAPQSATGGMQLGNQLWASAVFNNQLQTTQA